MKRLLNFTSLFVMTAFIVGCQTGDEEVTAESLNESHVNDAEIEEKPEVEGGTNEVKNNYYNYSEIADLKEGDDLHPDILENFYLPVIHENTLIYNGTVNPKHSVRFEFSSEEGEQSLSSDEPDVSVEGNFSLSFSGKNLEEGDELKFYVYGDDLPGEQAFSIPVHSTKEGMEVVVNSDGNATPKEGLLGEIDLPSITPNRMVYEAATSGRIEAAHYAIDGEINSQNLKMSMADENEDGTIFTVFDKKPEVGQNFEFYFIANGYTVKVDKKVEEVSSDEQHAVDKIRDESVLPEINVSTNSYAGEVISGSEVIIVNHEVLSSIIRPNLDEDGHFMMNMEDLIDKEGETILFSITDEEGFTATIKREVLEKDQ